MGRRVPELEEVPVLAPCLMYLWGWFQELNSNRGNNGFGLSPITDGNIGEWREERNMPRLLPYEMEVIRVWDLSFRESYLERKNEEANATRGKRSKGN
jgi:hypothetical protein